MSGMGKHAQDDTAPAATAEPPAQQRDHFWVVGIIAGCALAETAQ